jgi:hypothetical protein
MRKFAIGAVVVCGVAAATLALAAPVLAAPTGAASAADTVNELQANGYKVILNKVGGAPLSQCTVTSIRPGQQITEPVTAGGGNLTDKVLFTTVFVTTNC